MEDWSSGPKWKPQRAWGAPKVGEDAEDSREPPPETAPRPRRKIGSPATPRRMGFFRKAKRKTSSSEQGFRKRFSAGFGRADLIVAGVFAALALVLVVVGLGGSSGDQSIKVSDENPTTAWLQLAALEVVADGPSVDAPPYDRDNFGKGWGDLDGDGCNTRNEILTRDLNDPTYQEGTGDCVVETGTLIEPYTGEEASFVRGTDTSGLLQIDHVVALGDAWQAGAWQWDPATRHAFANDPLNLLAVDGHQNYVKGALTANDWLPPDQSFHCQFAIRQVVVKHKWDLSVQVKEKETLQEVLSKCEEQELDP